MANIMANITPRGVFEQDLPISLDIKDRKILSELDRNARQSAARIGRQVGMDKQAVIYRINRLLENGVVQKFYVILDTAKLGFTTYKIFLRLQNTDIKKQKEILAYLTGQRNVQFLMSADGSFDIACNVLARRIADLHFFIRELENRYGAHIAEKEIITMVFSSFFSRDYTINTRRSNKRESNLHNESDSRKPMFFGSEPASYQIDAVDETILSLLGIDARMPLVEIAKQVHLNADTIGVRIKRLEQTGIIQNYVLLPDFSRLGQLSYKVLFRLRDFTDKRGRMLLEYARTNPYIWFHSQSLGRWDLEINMDVEHAEQFRQVMMEMKVQFSDVIKEYTTLQVARVHKFNFYPSKSK